MRVRYCDKVFIFIIVAILLLIDNTNFAKADNYADKFYSYDSYQDPDYQYPDQSSKYSFFFHICTGQFYYECRGLPVLAAMNC